MSQGHLSRGHGNGCVKRIAGGKCMRCKEWKAFFIEEDGIGVIEVVLILVVLVGLVIIFKKQITALLENVFKEIENQSKEVY